MLRGIGVLAGMCAVVTSLFPISAGASDGSSCRDVRFEARLARALPVSVYGRYCRPAGATARTPLQVLVPGATYNHSYWDYPRHRYSYTAHATESGFATLAIDRLGSGRSSRPPSVLLTAAGQAEVVHQVIQQAIAGRVPGVRHERVALVGHSLGSAIATVEAATYRDVDAVVLTGVTHGIDLGATADTFLRRMHPALVDPAMRTLDPGYVTTRPGHRSGLFLSDAGGPGAAELDERTRDVVSATEVPDAIAVLTAPVSRRISVPVLLAVGDRDKLFCGPMSAGRCATAATLRAAEGPDYAELETFVLPGAGHSLNLMPRAARYMTAVQRWLHARLG
ncbi:alpha/beta hydrolase [Saccharopolyspora rosea]|uniref:Alpha/beta hydrolase n=1 Tax=Saccharopolyspora rosea TaxID=524884 RepID=A0ABW3G1S3_9PSEU